MSQLRPAQRITEDPDNVVVNAVFEEDTRVVVSTDVRDENERLITRTAFGLTHDEALALAGGLIEATRLLRG